MRGVLIYDSVGKARNEWFIGRLTESAEALGHRLDLVVCDGEYEVEGEVDFAIVRTINPRINEHLEALGIPTFNNAKTSRIANDKWQTYLLTQSVGIPAMNTKKPSCTEEALTSFPYPFVVKAVDGHGGSEVFAVRDEAQCREVISRLGIGRIITQQMCSEVGVDMRVYMLGGEILAAAKRTSLSDFRSNFSLGGSAEIVDVPGEVKGILRTVYDSLKCDFVGVDFIRHGGKWILNEIEDVVGTRMLYSLTDVDAAKIYVEYVIKKLTDKQ